MNDFYNLIDKINYYSKRLCLGRDDLFLSLRFYEKEAFAPKDIFNKFLSICKAEGVSLDYIFIVENNILKTGRFNKKEYKYGASHAHVLIKSIDENVLEDIRQKWIKINYNIDNSFHARLIHDVKGQIRYIAKQLNSEKVYKIDDYFIETSVKKQRLKSIGIRKKDDEIDSKTDSKEKKIINFFFKKIGLTTPIFLSQFIRIIYTIPFFNRIILFFNDT